MVRSHKCIKRREERQMKKVILNSKEFKNIKDLHKILKDKLKLPKNYGDNLDALWDCLTGWIDLPLTIEWIGFDESQASLGDYAQKLLQVLQDAEREIDGFKLVVK